MNRLTFRKQPTKEIIELLKSVTLGTNGAKYRHLDTEKRITEIDEPVHISIERNEKPLINMTVCQRGRENYIRYFAAQGFLQGKGLANKKKPSYLWEEINDYFEEEIQQGKCFYAYIDPKNAKSAVMSERFDFTHTSTVVTQTFSRVQPKQSNRLKLKEEKRRIDIDLPFYFKHDTPTTITYSLIENNTILAQTTVKKVHWKIERLPGKAGGLLTKTIPYIPGLNRIIQPKKHAFIVPENIYVQHNSPELLNELLSGILFEENENLLIWWVDEKHALYQKVKNQISWGPLHRLTGTTPVHLVTKGQVHEKSPFFVNGFDFV